MATKEEIDKLEEDLDGILPDNYEETFETHEDLYELFQWAFEKADDVARKAIKLLRVE